MPAKDTKAQSIDNGFSLISDDKLLALYAALLKCRALSRRMGERETPIAAAVGVASHLLGGDTLAASGAGAIVRLVKSGFSESRSSHSRFSESRSSGVASLRRILATHPARRVSGAAVLKAALRAALAHKGRVNQGETGKEETGKGETGEGEKSTRIAVAFCEDTSAPAQIWRKSLHEAASEQLPILFVCCAEEEAEDVQSLVPKSRFPMVVVDCNDVVAIYRVASEAIAHARRGNGPTLMVCQPWPVADRRDAHAHDPILNMEKYLAGKRLFSAEFKRKTTSRFARELRAAALDKL